MQKKNSWRPSCNVLYTCILSLLKHANKMIFNFSYSEYGSHVVCTIERYHDKQFTECDMVFEAFFATNQSKIL